MYLTVNGIHYSITSCGISFGQVSVDVSEFSVYVLKFCLVCVGVLRVML